MATATRRQLTRGGKMSTPTDDNAFLHDLEHNVRDELTLAEAGQPDEQAAGTPIDEWQFDPADALREEIGLRNLLGAVVAMEKGSRPDDHPPPTDPPTPS
jgi:hypothetical protein